MKPVASAFRRKVVRQRRHQRPQRGRGQQRIERRLQDQDLVEGQHAGQRRERRRYPRGAIAEPRARRCEHEADRRGPHGDLHEAHERERVGHAKRSREEVDVKRRHVVEAGSQRDIPGEDALRELHVGRGIEPGVRLQQRMMLQLREDDQFDEEHGGEKCGEPPAPSSTRFRSVRARRPSDARAGPSHSDLRLYNKKRPRAEARDRSTGPPVMTGGAVRTRRSRRRGRRAAG